MEVLVCETSLFPTLLDASEDVLLEIEGLGKWGMTVSLVEVASVA